MFWGQHYTINILSIIMMIMKINGSQASDDFRINADCSLGQHFSPIHQLFANEIAQFFDWPLCSWQHKVLVHLQGLHWPGISRDLLVWSWKCCSLGKICLVCFKSLKTKLISFHHHRAHIWVPKLTIKKPNLTFGISIWNSSWKN